jgi:hypothetical protein
LLLWRGCVGVQGKFSNVELCTNIARKWGKIGKKIIKIEMVVNVVNDVGVLCSGSRKHPNKVNFLFLIKKILRNFEKEEEIYI